MTFMVNFSYICLMYLAQIEDRNLPDQHSVIPGTEQRFLYMEDFYTMTYGDIVGVFLIAVVFCHLIESHYITANQWIIFAVVAVVSAGCFLNMCMAINHKPDQGFPDIGQISRHGLVHLPYFGVAIAMSALSWSHFLLGNIRGSLMWMGLFGGTEYLVCVAMDIAAGNFNLLLRIGS